MGSVSALRLISGITTGNGSDSPYFRKPVWTKESGFQHLELMSLCKVVKPLFAEIVPAQMIAQVLLAKSF